MKILIYERNRDIRSLYQAIFTPFRADLVFTDFVCDTETILNEQAFDLIVLDLDFPSMDGWTVAQKILTDYPLQPLVLVSSVPIRQESLEAGARSSQCHIIRKPFDITDLRMLIKRFVLSNPTTCYDREPVAASCP